MNRRWDKEKFVKIATEIHGSLYDYSLTEWQHIKGSVTIICKEHGKFQQIPDKHIRGQGCCACKGNKISNTKRKLLSTFVVDCEKVHGKRYNYDLVNYKNNYSLVEIVCGIHGSFHQSPTSHLSGAGCPACNSTGFVSNKPANFYIATNGVLTKVGITNKHPTLRLKDVSNSAKSDFEIIEYFSFENGRDALSLETYMLRQLNNSFEVCKTQFDGCRECFYDVPYSFIKQHVSSFCLQI